ncbi:MAG TPA: AI-2E family transporter [Candidatus Eisenbacteria bacterium]|nr:AI-2E family transporter [Candidatus Eisenbacteria bacterium]
MYSRPTKLWFLGLLTLLVVGVALVITRPFLYPVAAATVLAVVFNPVHERILAWTKGKPGSAALLSTLTLLFVFGIPVFIIISLAANEAVTAAQYLTRKSAAEGGFALFLTTMAERGLKFVGHWIDLSKYDIRGTITSHVQQAGVWVLGSGAAILSGFARLMVNALITLVIVFFLFRDGRDWIHRAVGIIPLSPDQASRLISNISDTIVANVYGILSVGVVQGILTGVALAIVRISSPLLLGLGAAFASIIPVVGAGLVWIPAGLYLIFTGAMWKGVFVLLWGAFVISTADNIVRPWVVSGKVELHPLVLLFFILGGVEAFGFLGLFLGPVIASVMAVLIAMFREELSGSPDTTAT